MLFEAPQYNEFSRTFDVRIEIPYADGLGFDVVRRIDEVRHFDIIQGHLSRSSQPYATPHGCRVVSYLVRRMLDAD